MIKQTVVVSLLAASLLLPAPAYAAVQAHAKLGFVGGGETTTAALLKDGRTYVSTSMWESAGLRTSWRGMGERLEYGGWNKQIAIRVGSRTGVLDGKLVDIGAVPFEYQNRVYVPLRFVARSLDGIVTNWDAKDRVATASQLHTYASASAMFEKTVYTVDKSTGRLYSGTGASIRKIADLGSPLQGRVTFEFANTLGGLRMISITDVYGEPGVNHAHYTVILKNGGLIRQASVTYQYRSARNAIVVDGNKIALTDGRTLRLIEDSNGKVTAVYNLVQMGDGEDRFLLEGIGENYLLTRPNGKGLLTFNDLQTGSQTLLYKELLDAKNQEYVETNDVPYRGDHLEYVGREGSQLLFRNNAPFTEDTKIYRFELP